MNKRNYSFLILYSFRRKLRAKHTSSKMACIINAGKYVPFKVRSSNPMIKIMPPICPAIIKIPLELGSGTGFVASTAYSSAIGEAPNKPNPNKNPNNKSIHPERNEKINNEIPAINKQIIIKIFLIFSLSDKSDIIIVPNTPPTIMIIPSSPANVSSLVIFPV